MSPLRLVRDDETPERRDPRGAAIALVLIVLGVIAARAGGPWYIAATLLLLFGIPGLIESLALAERDHRGIRIRNENPKES